MDNGGGDEAQARRAECLPFAPDFLRVHEPEIAIEIGRGLMLSEAPFDAAAIEAATRAVLPAIEIIGTYFDPWAKAGAPNLASDNAAFRVLDYGRAHHELERPRSTGWARDDFHRRRSQGDRQR